MKGHGLVLQTPVAPSKILSICLFISSSNRGRRRYNIGFTVLPVFGHVYLSVLNFTDMYFLALVISFAIKGVILNKIPLIWISLSLNSNLWLLHVYLPFGQIFPLEP